MNNRPAELLLDLELKEGWKVVELLEKPKDATGGFFSISYRVKNKNGNMGFLKAFDYAAAFKSKDIMRALQEMSTAYNFEKDLLYKCKSKKLSKIIMPIAWGDVEVQSEIPEIKIVSYLIFELADGDVRKLHNSPKGINLVWCLQSLHNTAVALKQLHSIEVAHQDLKPSNVLCFMREIIFKISDLGSASSKMSPCNNDKKRVPGDQGYAPIELRYGYINDTDFYRRYGIDLYLLGSLIFYYFSDVSATKAIFSKLKGHTLKNLTYNNFTSDLPYIRKAFFEAVEDLKLIILQNAGKLTNEIISIVIELCEPDPIKRGNPSNIKTSPHDLQKYISKFDILAKKAQYTL